MGDMVFSPGQWRAMHEMRPQNALWEREFLWPRGQIPFLLGPGSIHVAHTPDEKIAKKELLEAVDLYYNLATSLVS